jgi:gamma-glutamyltranspeptidase/glutathione hydrolase
MPLRQPLIAPTPPSRRTGRLSNAVCAFAVLVLAACAGAVPQRPQPPPEPGGADTSVSRPWVNHPFSRGAVAASDRRAAEAGALVLARGGNAIDAAAVVQFMLNVVEPQSAGIGGGGFHLVHLARAGETFVLDSREQAPSAMTPEVFATRPEIDFSVRSTSGYAVGVPGAVLGVADLLDRAGTISLAQALEPAIRAAAEGVTVGPRLARNLAEALAPGGRLGHEPGDPAYEVARSVFAPGGRPLAAGERLIQPDLARTFRLLAEVGPAAFYDCRHELARTIVATQAASRTAIRPHGQGQLTCDDLAGYRTVLRPPIDGTYRGFSIVSVPPPSSGGVGLIQMLKMLERFPIGDREAGLGFGEPTTLQLMQDAMRLAFADRALWLGDTDRLRGLPVAGLLADDYIRLRSASCPDTDPGDGFACLEPGRRLAPPQPGDPRPFAREAALLSGAGQPPAPEESPETTHFTVVDGDGNIVTSTQTIEASWGSGLMVPGYGFLLNNQLTDFNTQPSARDDGFPDPGANDPAPLKRPRSSMTPTIVFRGGRPVAAYGSPGGATIINTVLNVTLNLIDHRMPVQQAIDAPRISLTFWDTDGTTVIEDGLSPETRRDLEGLGYRFRQGELGAVQAIVVDPLNGSVFAGADARREGWVAGLPPPSLDDHPRP